jgi:outer membrane protein assembly factor BamB
VNSADPIIVDQKLFISSGYGKGCALYDINREEPKELWKNRKMRNQYSTCIIWDGYIYGFDGNIGGSGDTWTAGTYHFRCLDFKTGTMQWSHSGLALGALTMADGKLILLAVDGLLLVVSASPEKYEELARAKVLPERCWTVPVFVNGKIFVRNAQGEMLCLDVRTK